MILQKEQNTQLVEFLTKHYSYNNNALLAEHLNIIINADVEDGEEKKITARTISYYAKKLGLKKSPAYLHNKAISNSMREHIKHIGSKFTFYSGRPSADVRLVEREGEHLILCASRKQMRCIRVAASRYNSKQSCKTGIHIKVSCDKEKLSVLLIPEPISLPDSCKIHSSPEESRCAPP